MKRDQKFVVEGYVTEELPGTKFRVKIDVEGEEHEIIAYLSGKMRMNYIKILDGDFVKVEMTPYDPTQGRIVYRGKTKPTSEKEDQEEKKEDENDGNVEKKEINKESKNKA